MTQGRFETLGSTTVGADIQAPTKKMLLIRCGDDEAFEVQYGLQVTPLQHIRTVYRICYQHTQPGGCRALTDPKFRWYDRVHELDRIKGLCEIKKPDLIGIANHYGCKAWNDILPPTVLCSDRHHAAHIEQMQLAVEMLRNHLPAFREPGKILPFFLTKEGKIKAIGEKEKDVHKDCLRLATTPAA